MAAPIRYEEFTFESGWVDRASPLTKTRGFHNPIEAWRLPGQQDTVASFGPYQSKETDITGTVAKVASAILAKDSSGNVLRVVHDITAGAVKKLNANGTLGSSLKTGTSTTTPVAFIVYNDKILCFDGTTTPFQIVISSEAVSDIGLSRPDSTAGGGITTSLTGGGSGNVKGVVKYYVAEITGSSPNIVESALSLAFGQIDAGDGDQVTITFPNNAEFNSKTFYIYRTYANREAPNFLGQIAVGASGGTFVDNIADDDLGDLPQNHGDAPPSGITAAAVYNDIVYGLAGNDLYFSDPGQEESWWTASNGNIISVDRGDGDVGVALFVDPDGLVVFKKHHIYKLLGSSPSEFQLIPVVSADAKAPTVGTPKLNTIAGIPGGAVFYHDQSFYLYSLGQVRLLSGALSGELQGITKVDVIDNGALIYDPRFNVIYCAAKGTQISSFSLLWVFHVGDGAWLGSGPQESRLITAFLYDPEQTAMFVFAHRDSGQDEYECYWAPHGSTVHNANLETVDTSDSLRSALGQIELPSVYGSSPSTEKRILWLETEVKTNVDTGTLTLAIDENGAGTFSNSETDAFTGTRTKHRFNLGKYGWMREFRGLIKWDYPIHIYRVLVAYQERPSRSL